MNTEEHKTKPKRPGVGIGTIVVNNEGKILMGKRVKAQLYGFPGGHLEQYESWEYCSSRELKEETDLDIPPENMKFYAMLNVIDEKDHFHYIDIVMVCKYIEGQPVVNLEPHSCEGWEWWSLEDLETRKSEIFYPIQFLIQHKEDFTFDKVSKLLA